MHTNRLAGETSPYLLQHAHNPVDWYPWGTEALEKAKAQDKPIIVSIGYSACHWCHVMERESFEHTRVAEIMNAHFVCIKVDREERPDIDAIYMDAVQAMGIQGGWPLNVLLTPEAKPFYGGTYFPARDWANLLLNINKAYQEQKDQLFESAEQFAAHLSTKDSDKYGLQAADPEVKYTVAELDSMFANMARNFDTQRGGMNRAPKFPMPSIYLFLLRYYQLTGNEKAVAQIRTTLNEMAFGGIYDQVGGGFARYSVDADWFAPHFEKMLYDNGQLLSVYSEAYSLTKDSLYKDVVYHTIDFIEREMTGEEGNFYSALDADSEGEEGKFYVWTKDELDQILGSDSEWFCDYYQVKQEGNWEHGKNILHRKFSEETYARKQNTSAEGFRLQLHSAHATLMQARAQRVRPGLDDKVLCSWNALMLKGLVDAYRTFGEYEFLQMALHNAEFLQKKMRNGKKLWHTYKNGRASLDGFLEDYAAVVQAYLALYQATFEERWLTEAQQLADYVITHFYDAEEELFFFTDVDGEVLIARKKELFDNVIPASNSMMAHNLYFLGLLTDQATYSELSARMLARVKKIVLADVQYMTNWACLATSRIHPTVEIAIVGDKYLDFRREFDQVYFPNKVLAGMKEASVGVPLLENRTAQNGETTIYVCYNRACRLPVNSVERAWEQVDGSRSRGE